MDCPNCQIALNKQNYEGVEIDKCSSCGGTWLDVGELSIIVETKEKKFEPRLIQETIEAAYAGVPKEEIRRKMLCPVCKRTMKALNYDYKSGIIIDSCIEHGLWFDKGELEKIQIHREHWEKEVNEHEAEWLALAKSVAEDKKNMVDENRKREMRPTKYLVNSIIRKLLGA